MVKTTDDICTLASIGCDIGKDVFHIVGFALDGAVVLRRKFKRLALVSECKKLPVRNRLPAGLCRPLSGREAVTILYYFYAGADPAKPAE